MNVCLFVSEIKTKDTKYITQKLNAMRAIVEKNELSFDDAKAVFTEIMKTGKFRELISFKAISTFSMCFVDSLVLFAPKIPIQKTGELDEILNIVSAVFSYLRNETTSEGKVALKIFEKMESIQAYSIYGAKSGVECIKTISETKNKKCFSYATQIINETEFGEHEFLAIAESCNSEDTVSIIKEANDEKKAKE